MDQIADQLISQLYAFKSAVADLQKMAGVSTPALGNGLSDEEIASLLNRRERTLAKKFH
jgi:hypothetical protein